MAYHISLWFPEFGGSRYLQNVFIFVPD